MLDLNNLHNLYLWNLHIEQVAVIIINSSIIIIRWKQAFLENQSHSLLNVAQVPEQSDWQDLTYGVSENLFLYSEWMQFYFCKLLS